MRDSDEAVTQTVVDAFPCQRVTRAKEPPTRFFLTPGLQTEVGDNLDAWGLPQGVDTATNPEAELYRGRRNAIESDSFRRRSEQAKAVALMDIGCLRLLGAFCQQGKFYIDSMGELVSTPQDWIRIALLVRADFIEPLGSIVRVTSEGKQAWKDLDADDDGG